MGMINCPECNREISDLAESCPHCGYPLKKMREKAQTLECDAQMSIKESKVANTEMETKAEPVRKKVQPIKKKNSPLSICAFILSFFGPIGVVGIILGIVDLVKGKKDNKHGFSIAAIVIGSIILLALNSGSDNSANEPSQGTVATSDEEIAPQEAEVASIQSEKSQQDTEVVEKVKEKVVEDPAKSDMTKDDFVASCSELSYKEIARNPDNFVGQNFTYTAYVSSAREGGMLTGHQKYYVTYFYDQATVDEMVDKGWLDSATDDNARIYGMDYDRCVWLLDNRDTNSSDYVKILEGDVIQVYGTFNGMQESTNSLTRESGEEVALDIKYVDLISE